MQLPFGFFFDFLLKKIEQKNKYFVKKNRKISGKKNFIEPQGAGGDDILNYTFSTVKPQKLSDFFKNYR